MMPAVISPANVNIRGPDHDKVFKHILYYALFIASHQENMQNCFSMHNELNSSLKQLPEEEP